MPRSTDAISRRPTLEDPSKQTPFKSSLASPCTTQSNERNACPKRKGTLQQNACHETNVILLLLDGF